MNILGVHFNHDANAALVMDGKIVADIMEERFNRVKHSADSPVSAMSACLELGGISMENIDVVAVSGKNIPPEFYRFIYEEGRRNSHLPVYCNGFKIRPGALIKSYDHHKCHAATAYFMSPEGSSSLIVVGDGYGDDCSISIWLGEENRITLKRKYPGEASLGWFYSCVTEALGWIHGDGEGKTMAMAAGGDARKPGQALKGFCPGFVKGRLTDPHDFGVPGKLVQRGAIQWYLKDASEVNNLKKQYSASDIAAGAQTLLENELTDICGYWLKESGQKRLCLGGGIFLNIILNRHLANAFLDTNIFVYPNPGDSGLALGAALCALEEINADEIRYGISSLYLGPEFSDTEIEVYLKRCKLDHEKADEKTLCRKVAEALAEDKCVGWFQGRMETGPRALGNRSILMSPMNMKNRDYVNHYVKFRESFRPFCPSIIDEDRKRYLIEDDDGSYMIMAFSTPESIRSKIEAVIHVDGTIRPQIVSRENNPLYYSAIKEFKNITGEGIILNTSFNIKGEPIVLSHKEAVRCFFSSGMDLLAIGSFILRKEKLAN